MVVFELFDDVWALARGTESAARLAARVRRGTQPSAAVWRSWFATGEL
jgi:hypothetical protein